MGFLDSNIVSIDAILTKRGRELLAAGQFNPTKFALSDDEIDYGMLALSDGESNILQTRVLEAGSMGSESNSQLRYKLIRDSNGLTILPITTSPHDFSATLGQVFEITINDDYLDSATRYTVVNNRGYATISPEYAITMANQISSCTTRTGRTLAAIISNIQNVGAKYSGSTSTKIREQYLTQADSVGTHRFFVFVYNETASPVHIEISSNTTGVPTTFTINAIAVYGNVPV